MYEQYSVKCKNTYCNAVLALPSEQIYVPGDCDNYFDSVEEPTWPAEDWKANLACPRCRCIREYEAYEIWQNCSSDRETQPQCLRVDMGCAKSDCKLPVCFYLLPICVRQCRQDGDDIELNSDVVELLRNDWFNGKCPKGHHLERIPKALYHTTPHLGCIPSQDVDIYWVQHSSRLIRTSRVR